MKSPLEQCRDALKPCPFCGAKPGTLARPDNIDGSEFYAAVFCHCEGYSATAHVGRRGKTQDEATSAAHAAWNRRPAAAEAALAAQPEPSSVRQCALWVIDAYNSKRPDYLLRSIQKLTHALDGGAAPVAAPVAQPPEPDMRHPKIQRLIGAKARCEIELGLVEQLVEDPNFDATSMEMEYWGPLHDRLKSALEAKPVAQPLTDQQITAIVREAAKGSAIRRDGSTSHRIARAIERAHGIHKDDV